MLNAFTIDLEEYFQVSKFEGVIPRESWDQMPSRVRSNTIRILELLAEYNCKATFFTVGWVAEKYPDLIREIADEGHEVASHSYWHRRVSDLTPDEFQQDIHRCKAVLEDVSGKPVKAFRAPTYSIIKSSQWAWDVLINEGFEVDSSVFPIRHHRYGNYGIDRFPHKVFREGGSLIEFPLSTMRVGGSNFPIIAGGYLRFFPYTVTKYGISRINRVEKKPAVIAFHPWELDPHHPMPNVAALKRIRHKINIDSTERKLRQALADFEFGTLNDVLNQIKNEIG
jgi:polysaccharide deacetylase family protein (PEP-CTERM system associated)